MIDSEGWRLGLAWRNVVLCSLWRRLRGLLRDMRGFFRRLGWLLCLLLTDVMWWLLNRLLWELVCLVVLLRLWLLRLLALLRFL